MKTAIQRHGNPKGIQRTDRRLPAQGVTIATFGGAECRIVRYTALRGDTALRVEGPKAQATYYPQRGVLYGPGGTSYEVSSWDELTATTPKGRESKAATIGKAELQGLLTGLVA